MRLTKKLLIIDVMIATIKENSHRCNNYPNRDYPINMCNVLTDMRYSGLISYKDELRMVEIFRDRQNSLGGITFIGEYWWPLTKTEETMCWRKRNTEAAFRIEFLTELKETLQNNKSWLERLLQKIGL